MKRHLHVVGGTDGPAPRELPHEAFLAALSSLPEVGPSRLRWLLSLGSPPEVWARVVAGRLPVPPSRVAPSALRSLWLDKAAEIDPRGCWERCEQLGVGVVSLGSPGYPAALAQDPEPPVVLFHHGDPDRIAAVRVGIVGTRRSTGYGVRTAEGLGAALTAEGISVVSGLALGIDAAAHRGAVGRLLDVQRATAATPATGAPAPGAPVAVVAGGLDAPGPRRNRPLAEQIVAHGVIVSEVPPGVDAARWRFPVRNRIIAALCDALVVVESAGAGGSMHTVREAMDRDVPVFAVPGPIDSRSSEGTNELLRDGAQICLAPDDVIAGLGLVAAASTNATPPTDRRVPPTGAAAAVLDAIGWRPASAEQLALACGLDFSGVSSAITQLETAGWVERSGGWVERVAGDRAGP